MINNIISIFILIIYLFTISPIIDHLFPPLDKNKEDHVLLGESILHIIVILSVLYITNTYFLKKLNKLINVEGKLFELSKPVIVSFIMVGLQSHLISKLRYITHKHPFRTLI